MMMTNTMKTNTMMMIDDSYYEDYNNRYGYDDNGYLEQDKKSKIFPANKVSELGDRWSQWVFGIDTSVFNPFTEDFGQEVVISVYKITVDYCFL